MGTARDSAGGTLRSAPRAEVGAGIFLGHGEEHLALQQLQPCRHTVHQAVRILKLWVLPGRWGLRAEKLRTTWGVSWGRVATDLGLRYPPTIDLSHWLGEIQEQVPGSALPLI